MILDSKSRVTRLSNVSLCSPRSQHFTAQIMAMRSLDGELEKQDPNADKNLNDWALSSSLHVGSISEKQGSFQAATTLPTEHRSQLSLLLDGHTSDLPDDGQPFGGPKLITFDGDQTLYSDGANFESNPKLANYLYLLLKHGVTVAVVTAAGYEYETKKYELRLSGLLDYFAQKGLSEEDCDRFYLFGGECNYLLHVSVVIGVCCCLSSCRIGW